MGIVVEHRRRFQIHAFRLLVRISSRHAVTTSCVSRAPRVHHSPGANYSARCPSEGLSRVLRTDCRQRLSWRCHSATSQRRRHVSLRPWPNDVTAPPMLKVVAFITQRNRTFRGVVQANRRARTIAVDDRCSLHVAIARFLVTVLGKGLPLVDLATGPPGRETHPRSTICP